LNDSHDPDSSFIHLSHSDSPPVTPKAKKSLPPTPRKDSNTILPPSTKPLPVPPSERPPDSRPLRTSQSSSTAASVNARPVESSAPSTDRPESFSASSPRAVKVRTAEGWVSVSGGEPTVTPAVVTIQQLRSVESARLQEAFRRD